MYAHIYPNIFEIYLFWFFLRFFTDRFIFTFFHIIILKNLLFLIMNQNNRVLIPKWFESINININFLYFNFNQVYLLILCNLKIIIKLKGWKLLLNVVTFDWVTLINTWKWLVKLVFNILIPTIVFIHFIIRFKLFFIVRKLLRIVFLISFSTKHL